MFGEQVQLLQHQLLLLEIGRAQTLIQVLMLLTVLHKKKDIASLVLTQVMVVQTGHLFTQDLNPLGLCIKELMLLESGLY